MGIESKASKSSIRFSRKSVDYSLLIILCVLTCLAARFLTRRRVGRLPRRPRETCSSRAQEERFPILRRIASSGEGP